MPTFTVKDMRDKARRYIMATRAQEGDLHEYTADYSQIEVPSYLQGLHGKIMKHFSWGSDRGPACPNCKGTIYGYNPNISHLGGGHNRVNVDYQCKGCGREGQFHTNFFGDTKNLDIAHIRQEHHGALKRGEMFSRRGEYHEEAEQLISESMETSPMYALMEIAGFFDTDLPNRQRVIQGLKEMNFTLDPMPERGGLMRQGKAVFIHESGLRATVQMDHKCPYDLFLGESPAYTSDDVEEFLKAVQLRIGE